LRLTIYGRSVILKALVLTLALDIAAFIIPVLAAKLALLILSVLLFSFTLFFFRDPVRTLPDGLKSNDVISPADGRVMIIKETQEDLFLKSKAKLVSIFLSPLDVHVNRIPITGKIDYYRYFTGGFAAAFRESSENNERTVIGISAPVHRILMKQIAGFVARRIVCNLKIGANVEIGEKFGMIRFGSRVDLIMPYNTQIKVTQDQKVIGGETIIATLAG
jgi:phosphatidylserine decarboxylase